MPLSPQFCPQPRPWLQWPRTVGASLRPALGPAHSWVEAATPACGLVGKVRLADRAGGLGHTRWLSGTLGSLSGNFGQGMGGFHLAAAWSGLVSTGQNWGGPPPGGRRCVEMPGSGLKLPAGHC